MPQISQELKNTVALNPHIKQVYFTAAGEHFFNVKKHAGSMYGNLKFDPQNQNAAIVNSDTLITETLTREQVLL